MITSVSKFLVIGLQDHLDLFFQRAQEKGIMEFSSKKKSPLPQELQTLQNALKILKKHPIPKEKHADLEKEDILEMAHKIVDLNVRVLKFEEDLRLTESEISRIAPLGDFSIQDVHFIEEHTKRHLQFFCVSATKELSPEVLKQLFYIGTEFDLQYYLSIHTSKVSYADMIEMKVDKSLFQLKHHRSFIHESLHLLEAELKGYGPFFEHLYEAYLEFLDEHTLNFSKKEVGYPLSQSFFVTEAWVSDTKQKELTEIVEGIDVFLERIAPGDNEIIPTVLENTATAKIGEDLVQIYDVPAYNDKDPSLWVLWSFALFFAIIISDAGYGFIYLLISFLLLRKKEKLTESTKRLAKLVRILGISCVVWGSLTASFFGISFELDNPILKITPITYLVEKKAEYHAQVQDSKYQDIVRDHPTASSVKGKDLAHIIVQGEKGGAKPIYEDFSKNILLEFCLLLGLVHICISLIRYTARSWANIGWVIFSIGGYLYCPSFLDAATFVNVFGLLEVPFSYAVGKQLIILGIVLAVSLGVIQNKWSGLRELEKIVSIFADILSYLRLYALALASTIMASTFNEMGETYLKYGVGGLILLAGHVLNFGLGTMGGIIHGLRLNFIEWYHYSFHGGGRLFNPLRKTKMDN